MQSTRDLVIASNPQPLRMLPVTDKELSIKELWGVFVRRKSFVFGTLAVFVGLAILLCIVSTRRYEAIGQIQVQKDTADALGLESMIGTAENSSDALDANITMQTQAEILQSDSLALKVIKELDMEHTQDFTPKFSPVGWLMGMFSSGGSSDPQNASLDDAPERRRRVLKVFASYLKVKPVAGTRLIDIKYLSPDPKLSAGVVNHLIQSLIDFNFQTRYNATEQAAGWLGDKLSDLRKQSEDLQAKVVTLQRDSGVFSIGETDAQGRQEVYTPALDKLQQATAALGQAQSNRILKEALYQVVKSGDPELISGLAGSSIIGSASPGTSNSLVLIQSLRTQEATLKAQLNEMSAKFGPAYPKLAEIRANLDSVEHSVAAEVQRIGERAKNDFQISEQVEGSARSVFDGEKKRAEALNDKAIELMIVKQEADQSRTLYEGLLTKVKQAGVLAGLRSTNISVVDPARVPSKPARPNILIYMAAAIAGGVLFGSCGALLRDTMDNKIQDLPELEAYLGQTPLGILPYYKGSHATRMVEGDLPSAAVNSRSSGLCPAVSSPRSPYTESVRALRTSLMLSQEGAPPQVLLITSSVSGEGKSMLSLNLAALMAQQNQGKKVLLVDGDLRRPALHHRLKVNADRGLSSILAEDGIESSAVSAAIPVANVPGLDIMPSGPIPPYPAELLGSQQMREAVRIWRQNYDFIIIDGAPLLPVTDSVLLSSLADLTLVVARYRVTERQSLDRSCRLLLAQESPRKIGIVLNAVERDSSSYYQYYGYKNSHYYGRDQHA